jgi:copper chaperone
VKGETMGYTIAVENIKCGGCAHSIRRKLLDEGLARAVEVDVEQGEVRLEGDPAWRAQAITALRRMGYPEMGSVEGVKAAAAKAKSFVSCAVGRVDRAGTGKE